MFSKTLLVLALQAIALTRAENPTAPEAPVVPKMKDLNCTVDGKYVASAFQCENKLSDALCELNYHGEGENPKPAVGGDKERPLACFTSAADPTVLNMDAKNGAIKLCAKQCGYCCASSKYDERYNCENSNAPKSFPSCEKVTEEQCSNPQMRDMLARDCPKTCGLCNNGKCKDTTKGCEKAMCVAIDADMQVFAKKYCARTCGTCDKLINTPSTQSPMVPTAGPIVPPVGPIATFGPQVPTAGPTNPSANCRDVSPNCAAWVRNGFCKNTFYSDAMKASHCPVSCGLCNMATRIGK